MQTQRTGQVRRFRQGESAGIATRVAEADSGGEDEEENDEGDTEGECQLSAASSYELSGQL